MIHINIHDSDEDKEISEKGFSGSKFNDDVKNSDNTDFRAHAEIKNNEENSSSKLTQLNSHLFNSESALKKSQTSTPSGTNYSYNPMVEPTRFSENSLKGFLLNKNYKDITGEWAYNFKKWSRFDLVSHCVWSLAFLGVCSFFFSKTLFISLVHSNPLANIAFFGLVSLIALMTPLRLYVRHKFDLYKNENYFHKRITQYFLKNPDKLKEFLVEVMENPNEAAYFKNSENYNPLISSLEAGNQKEFHTELHNFLNLYQGAKFNSLSVDEFLKTGQIPESVKKNNHISWDKIKNYLLPSNYFKKNDYSKYMNPPSVWDSFAKEEMDSSIYDKKAMSYYLGWRKAKNKGESELDKLNRDFPNQENLFNTLQKGKDSEANESSIKKTNHQNSNTKTSSKYLYSK